MSAQVISGTAVAARVRARVGEGVRELLARGKATGLAVVLVGDDPASAIYVRNKTKAAQECGVAVIDHKLPASTTQLELLGLIAKLNADPAVDGILVQLPLPPQIESKLVIAAIRPDKDADGFHPENVGLLAAGAPRVVPCTPKGCMELLAEAKTDLRGARAIVVGRSNIVGKPMAHLLLAADATVTIAHSRSKDLAGLVAASDVVVAAVGRARLIEGTWIKPGAVVIDVGMNRGADGKLCGDVDFDGAAARARAITPVPGGVGPMTIAMLLENTLEASRARVHG